MQRFTILLTLFALASQSCAHTVPRTATAAAADDIVIPTRYFADRFFATPVLARGDTASFFLDTGSGSFVWDSYLPWFEVSITDSISSARGGKVAVVPMPAFRAERSLPSAIWTSAQGKRLIVYPVDARGANTFAAWIGHESQGQLGNNWFADRVWTLDYPSRRLLLHRSAQSHARPTDVPLHFFTDSTGQRLSPNAFVDVVIAGDTITMLVDTGATIWLSAAAMHAVGEAGPAERATTHVPNWLFLRWRNGHPDWPVIEHADLWAGLSLIRVPDAELAGHHLGPMWLSVLNGPATPPDTPASLPAWRRRLAGTLGGSILRHFVVTLDYPRGFASFELPSR